MKKTLIFLFVIGLLFTSIIEFIEEFLQNDTVESGFQINSSDEDGISSCEGGDSVFGIPANILDGSAIPCGSGKGGGEGGVPG
jgi:hypothetical protein